MKTVAISGTALIIQLAAGSVALAEETKPEEAHFCGMVVKLTEDHCIGVKNSQPVLTYDITDARPRPHVGWTIEGHGMIDHGPNICQEGTRLSKVHWKRVHVCALGEEKHDDMH